MTWVAGVDGCRGGWCVVLHEVDSNKLAFRGPINHISAVLTLSEKPNIVAIDIPIGLLERAERGGRECERLARKMLAKRGCCVFSSPVRAVLAYCDNYESAKQANRDSSDARIGLSRQAFAICEKIREVDALMNAGQRVVIIEVHPELSFCEMNGGRPLQKGKKHRDGLKCRRELLDKKFGTIIQFALKSALRQDVAEDDILDACAACWTAERIALNQACVVPKQGSGPKIWF